MVDDKAEVKQKNPVSKMRHGGMVGAKLGLQQKASSNKVHPMKCGGVTKKYAGRGG